MLLTRYKVFSKISLALIFYVILMKLFISFNFSNKLSILLEENNIFYEHSICSAIGFISNELIIYLILIIILYCLFGFLGFRDKKLVSFKQKFSWKYVLKGLGASAIIYRVFFPFANSVVMPILNSMGINLGNNVFSTNIDKVNNHIVILIGVVLIAPICEEFIFRYLILNKLRVYGNLNAIITSSVLFALLHQNLNQFIYTLPLGLILGYFAIKSNSIIIPIFMHMFFNLIGNVRSISLVGVKSIVLILIVGFTIYGVVIMVKWLVTLFKNKRKFHIDYAIFYKTPSFLVYLIICLFYFFKV